MRQEKMEKRYGPLDEAEDAGLDECRLATKQEQFAESALEPVKAVDVIPGPDDDEKPSCMPEVGVKRKWSALNHSASSLSLSVSGASAAGSVKKNKAPDDATSSKKQLSSSSPQESKAAYWIGKMGLQEIVDSGGGGVDLHQARLCRDKLTDASPRLSLARRIELAELAQRLSPGCICKATREEALAAMAELQDQVTFPEHVAVELLEKELQKVTGSLLNDASDLSLQRFFRTIMPFDLSAVEVVTPEYEYMVAPLAPKKVELDVRNPTLSALSRSSEEKAGIAATRVIGKVLVPLVLEGKEGHAKVMAVVAWMAPVPGVDCDATRHD